MKKICPSKFQIILQIVNYSMKQSRQRQIKTIQQEETVPTKRFNSYQLQNRFRSSQFNGTNTPRALESIVCAFHGDQTITNFCKNKECLLPLCPKCIGIHCQEHSSMGIFGNFVMIEDSIYEASHSLKDVLGKLSLFEQAIKAGRERIKQKSRQINASIEQIKRKFMQKMATMLDTLQQSISNIWEIELNVYSNELKQSQQFSRILYENCNACLKKLMSPQQRLEGVIDYFYHQQNFKEVDQIKLKIENILSKPLTHAEYIEGKDSLLESFIKSSLNIANRSLQVWSEFKVLNSNHSKSQISANKDKALKVERQQQKHFKNMKRSSLDNFVSPLEHFSLRIERKEKK